MSKHQRGNKEAKKPKQPPPVAPLVVPGIAVTANTPSERAKKR